MTAALLAHATTIGTSTAALCTLLAAGLVWAACAGSRRPKGRHAR